MKHVRTFCVLVATAAMLFSACGSDNKATPAAAAKLSGTINVFAASSLTKGFGALGSEFEAANPGTKISFDFDSSSNLETQIEQGAPADVFASADRKNMDKVVKAGLNSAPPADFAQNKLEIAVEKGNPKHIGSVADLAKAGLTVVLCDSTVPCGKFADQVLANAKVKVTPKSREQSAKATLSKIELGEADAAIVYVSDIASSGKVDGVAIPDAVNVVTTLPVVELKRSGNAALSAAWIEFVLAHKSELVAKFGFLSL